MADQVADGIVRVPESRTNCYLVQDGDSIGLIDTGYPGNFGAVVAALEGLGRSLGDVASILLTHAHVDHIGSAERIRREHGATVHSHAAEAAHARGEVDEVISRGYMLSRLWWPKMASFVARAIRAGATEVERLAEVATFEGAAPLDLPGNPVPVFTPGHTSGHCAFNFPARGALMTGDGLVTHDSLTQKTGPRLLHKAFNHDQEQAVRSLQELSSVAADVVLPGHGEPFRGSPADAVDEAFRNLS